MTRTLVLWARRSSFPVLLVASLLAVAFVIPSRTGWQWQWHWAMSWATATTIVIAPLLAGFAALDTHRRLTPTLRIAGASAERGGRGSVSLILVLWGAAVLAWALGAGYAAFRAASAGAAGAPTGWIFGQALAALLAAAALGLVVGLVVPHVLAGPVAAVLAYAIPLVLMPFSMDGLLSAGGATGPSFGFEPDPGVAAGVLAANLLAAASLLMVALWMLRPAMVPHRIMTGVVVAAFAGCMVVLSFLEPRTSALRPTGAEPVCVGTETEVCGPPDARAVLELAQHDLSEGRRLLAEVGVATNDRYALVVGAVPAAEGEGILEFEPAGLADGHLSSWDVAVTLAMPTACLEYFGDEPPIELLEGQGRFAAWAEDLLVGRPDAQVDSAKAAETYQALRACDPGVLPTWDYGS